jgi:hypothetical protein
MEVQGSKWTTQTLAYLTNFNKYTQW